MADQKVTKMVMKVDLQCYKCYRKIKKVLCSCPKIRDQVFDEKQNTVTITVVCCSPEKIMEKIACNAGDMVESIEIFPEKTKEPEKKEESEKPKPVEQPEKPKPKPAEKPVELKKKEPEKPKETEKSQEPEKKKEPEKPKPAEPLKPEKPKVMFVEPPKEAAKPPASAPVLDLVPMPKIPAPAPALAPTQQDPIVQGFPQLTPTGPVPMYPVGMCCWCHEVGLCYHGYMRPPTWYDGCGQPAYEFPGKNRGYYINLCDYFSEENSSGCSIM